MRFGRQKYVLYFTSCIGLFSVLRLIQLLMPLVTTFVTIILIFSISILTLQLFKLIKQEKQSAVFDLSTPTAFDNGYLIFKSGGEKYAVFFAIALSLSSINYRKLLRTMKILLKVLPKSTIFTIEWKGSEECYASFYVKVSKDEFIARTRELVENIQTSFESIFSPGQVRSLSEPELLGHLAFGAQGKIRKATSVGRFSVKLATDRDHRIISLFTSLIGENRVKTILRKIPKNGSYRIILSVKKSEKQQSVQMCLNITSSTFNKEKHTALNQLATKDLIQRMPASEIIRYIGDILTRNFSESGYQRVSLDTAVNELSSFVKQCNVSNNIIQAGESTTEESIMSSGGVCKWREVLETVSEQLEIRLEKDVLLLIDGFPLRIDAKIQNIYIKIIPKYYHDMAKLQWLTIQLSDTIRRETREKLILLLEEPMIKPLIEEVLNGLESKRGVHIITSKHELYKLLSERKSDLLDPVVIATKAI